MDVSPSPSLTVPLPLPVRGACTRIRLGGAELVLECVRGGHSLLWSDGRQARRYVLGLANGSQLTLRLRAPRLPLRVVPRELLAVAPGARVCGYVHVPLVPTLTWHDASGRAHTLVELLPAELHGDWDDVVGHSFETASPWHARFPMRSGEPRAVVPIHLRNASSSVLSPANLGVTILDDELAEVRGSIVATPRRLRWLGDRFAATAPSPARSSGSQVGAGT